MTTLQKFKLLATQCALAGSPTRSPSASPVIHLRHRKTLRMLLGRRGGMPFRSPDRGEERNPTEKGKKISARYKLRDLFLSSPPAVGEAISENAREGLLRSAEGSGGRRGGWRNVRPLSATFRQRLLRRAWRPVLIAIPE